MSFNSMLREQNEIKNHAGAKAYALTPEMELYTAVVATALSNNFYEDKSGRIERIAELVKQVPHEFTAKLAVYTRNEMNLRSVPLLLIVELAKIHNGDNLVARAVEKCVLRADEIMELLMCYQFRNAHKNSIKKLNRLSRQIQNGLQKAFNRFDEYQFAKYNRDNLEVKLRDALFLVHPKAKDDAQQLIFNKITDRKLETPYTWETELSALGQQHFETDDQKNAAFCQKWEELIISGRLGYMALLRNLRNILESKVSAEKVNIVASILSNADQVAKSRQLPFRFLSAYRELQKIDSPDTPFLMSALEQAVKHSAANIEGFDADTSVLLACDVSGSMCHPVSPRSTVECYDIGLMLAMLLKSRCRRVVSGIFGDRWEVVNMPGDNILQSASELRKLNGKVGYSTNGFKVIDYLVENKIIIDKVMFFTDCQLWNSTGGNTSIERSWNRYRQIAPNAKLYFFDLVGYGQSPLKITDSGVYLIGGWSDKVFDVLSAVDKGTSAVERIMKVEV
ncbi:MAG: TROVE domain-containing protein [Bacteroidales bacterium]|nr:TROVE domain-containing protein [Bacteroidales bacterium]